MNRTQKEEQVAGLRDKLATALFLALADYRGVNVAEINHFRRTLKPRVFSICCQKHTRSLSCSRNRVGRGCRKPVWYDRMDYFWRRPD